MDRPLYQGLCEALDSAGTPELARLLTTKTWHWMDTSFGPGQPSLAANSASRNWRCSARH